MKEDTSNLRGQLKEHEDEIQDLRENTMRTQNRVLQLYQEEAPSQKSLRRQVRVKQPPLLQHKQQHRELDLVPPEAFRDP